MLVVGHRDAIHRRPRDEIKHRLTHTQPTRATSQLARRSNPPIPPCCPCCPCNPPAPIYLPERYTRRESTPMLLLLLICSSSSSSTIAASHPSQLTTSPTHASSTAKYSRLRLQLHACVYACKLLLLHPRSAGLALADNVPASLFPAPAPGCGQPQPASQRGGRRHKPPELETTSSTLHRAQRTTQGTR